ncbi:MAG: hypothetical protein N4A49_06170 [Marinifilaceae bacterium]|jgi:hypothetical protein|nr:hypothetical protein [Marinifilaceae bacterium]
MTKQFITTKFLIVVTISLIIPSSVLGQQIDGMFKKKKFRLSGSFSAQNTNYASFNKSRQQDAHAFYLAGNLNLSVLEQWNLPMSFTYSNKNSDLAHGIDYNQFIVNPSYKWVKLYFGNTSMSFSPYSLSGHNFLGLGLELNPPGDFSLSLMYGKLKKAQELDTSKTEQDDLDGVFSYKRLGGGFKLSYRPNGNEYQLISFMAKDDKNSIKNIPENTEITPMENFVIGLKLRKKLINKINFEIDFTDSYMCMDSRSVGKTKSIDPRKYLINNNSTTVDYKSISSKISYADKDLNIGFEYQRVDPEYQSLGAYFFTNDLENISLNFSKQLFEGKIGLSTNFGLQRNDLDNEKQSQMKNFVGALNLNIQANPRTIFTFSYSNYTSYTNIRSDFDKINTTDQNQLLDTLDFSQISQNISFSISKQLGNPDRENISQNLNINTNGQFSAEKKEGSKIHYGNKFYSSNMSYILSLKDIALNISSSLNSYYSDMKENNSLTIGPSLNISKSFKSKISCSTGISWNKSFENGKTQNRIYVIRGNLGYSIKKHRFSLSSNYMNRNQNDSEYGNFNLNFAYNYSF